MLKSEGSRGKRVDAVCVREKEDYRNNNDIELEQNMLQDKSEIKTHLMKRSEVLERKGRD